MNYLTKTSLSFSLILLTHAVLASEIYPGWAIESEQDAAVQWQFAGQFAARLAYATPSPYVAYTRPRALADWQVEMTFEAYTKSRFHYDYYGYSPQHAAANAYHKIYITLIANRYFKQFRVNASTHYDNQYSGFYRSPFSYREYP